LTDHRQLLNMDGSCATGPHLSNGLEAVQCSFAMVDPTVVSY